MAHPLPSFMQDLEARRTELDTTIESLRARFRTGDTACKPQFVQALVSRMFLEWMTSPTAFKLFEHPPRVCLACCEYYLGDFCHCAKRGVAMRNIRVLGSAAGGGLLADRKVPTRLPRVIEKTIAAAHARRTLDPDL